LDGPFRPGGSGTLWNSWIILRALCVLRGSTATFVIEDVAKNDKLAAQESRPTQLVVLGRVPNYKNLGTLGIVTVTGSMIQAMGGGRVTITAQ